MFIWSWYFAHFVHSQVRVAMIFFMFMSEGYWSLVFFFATIFAWFSIGEWVEKQYMKLSF